MVKIGQVWKDNDPRLARHVKVIAVGHSSVAIRRCNPDGSPLLFGWQAPRTRTMLSRFGKAGRRGFTLVKDA